MAPITPPLTPRIVVYYQTHHTPEGNPISVLPLITTRDTTVTHLILAAIHLNDQPGNITLNDHIPSHPRNQTLWAELAVLRASGVKVLGLLGGAARGSYERLDLPASPASPDVFEAHYIPLRDMIRERHLDGLDLDVEEPMSLDGIIRLIDRLKSDFGEAFIITMAPVAAALLSSLPEHNLSRFDYKTLEVRRGRSIAWYNTQFYCGWGYFVSSVQYDAIVARGFPSHKVVVGLVTNPENGSGWVPFELLWVVFGSLRRKYGRDFGGVMGWEYFNSLPGGREKPWEWAGWMTRNVRIAEVSGEGATVESRVEETSVVEKSSFVVADEDLDTSAEAILPSSFEYFTDGSADE